MNNLDDYASFSQLDPQNMLGDIGSLPGQIQIAWELGRKLPLPAWKGIDHVLIAGMGGSAIGGDLVGASIVSRCSVPVYVHRDYGLPAWAMGTRTLVIASSYSGNTEETLTSFAAARESGCRILSITTGGELAKISREAGVPVWVFEHHGQPRAAVGYSFALLLSLFSRLNFIPDPSAELVDAVGEMRLQQESICPEVPVVHNPAKRMAGQLMGRWTAVFGSGLMAPVARRWKGQINELAKAWAQFEPLPEADHNTLAGSLNPPDLFGQGMVLFLTSPSDYPRNRLRSELTRKALMLEGLNTDFIQARGNTPLANLWTALHFGDYVAYYLAMAYGVDPTPIAALEDFKKELKAIT